MISILRDIEYRDDIILPTLNNEHGVERLQNLNMGLWEAFLDKHIRNEFKKFLEEGSESKYEAVVQYESMIRYIELKRKTVFNKRLKNCADVSSFTACLLEMFETYNTYYTTIYSKSPYLMFKFLDYILEKDFNQEPINSTLDAESRESVIDTKARIRKGSKFSIILPDGKEIIKVPSSALEQFIDFAGIENVAAKNAKLLNKPFVTKKPFNDDLRYYRQLKNSWYMVTGGDTIAKFRLLVFLNQSLNLGLKLKMV